ncbi:HD domain-containing phosphohydrolase [Sulfurovum sp.]|uniref:HD domain-containing phosphohydrolase n=1 Tax=Sulfurovum sp. TaxID=1969726 RepID=UPI002867F2A5|nr:HD domain-containing phosphohydrolase [Sulfurovum sp.]
MFNISIKTNILAIFLSLVGVVAFSLIFLQYYFSEKLAVESTHRTFSMISKNISEHLRKKGTNIRTILNVIKEHKTLLEPITFDPFHPSLKGLTQALEISPDIYALYFAQQNGRLYEVVNMNDNPVIFEAFKAPALTKWTIITIINNKRQMAYLDKDMRLIVKAVEEKIYDPRQRIWYKNAMKKEGVVPTEPYLYSNLQRMGISYSTRLDVPGVVLALDFTMVQLNNILALQDSGYNSEIFLSDNHGEKYASSAFATPHFKKNPELDQYLKEKIKLHHGKGNKSLFTDKKFKTYYRLQPLIDSPGYLGITVDARPLLKPYYDNLRYSLVVALFLLLMAFPVILYASDRIIKPIKSLLNENEKIKNREFDKVEKIDTHIVEFIDLSDSQVSMSKSIQVYQKSQEEILDAIIKLIAEAIDAKSPYTGGHCKRVPLIAQQLLDEANRSENDIFKDFSLTSKDELREFEIGAWLHDCGKVTTPEYVVDKATKLETICNRIHEIRMRFEVLWRDVIIDHLSKDISEDDMKRRHRQLQDDFAFIASVNIGGEFMDVSHQTRVNEIAKQEWQRHFDDRLGLGEVETLRYPTITTDTILPVTEKLLDNKPEHIVARTNFNYEDYKSEGFKGDVPENLYNYGEVYNLCIEKGTLTEEERYKINEHVIMSIKMLEKIPFPKIFSNIVEYAGTHHETLIGTGYPRQLSKEDLSIPARIMAIADIFEALTASDRPYKKAKTLSSSIKIMSFMVKDQHIDADLFKLFLSTGVYKTYANDFLEPEQIDEVNIDQYLDV